MWAQMLSVFLLRCGQGRTEKQTVKESSVKGRVS